MLTAMHGANAYWMPVALTSSAVAAPILFTRLGSLHGAVVQGIRQSTYATQDGLGNASWSWRMRLPGGSETDVVGEDGGTVHVVVAVHGVDAVDHRDAEARGQARPLEVADHGDPLRRRGLLPRHAPAAAQQAADVVVPEHLRRRDEPLDLRHLADLLGQRHPGQEVPDADLHVLAGVLVRRHALRGRGPEEEQQRGHRRRREQRHPVAA
jgi:hypothetical protein